MNDARASLPPTLADNPRLDRWVTFNADGTVTARSGKVELGQGILSAIAQLAAEELDVAYERIRMQPLNTTLSPNERSTSGSRSIQEGGASMRQACSEIRAIFLEAAAQRLGTEAGRLSVVDGIFSDPASGRKTSYWELAGTVDLARDADGSARPKGSGDFRLMGQSLPRLDILSKITGAAYIQDIELPGMLHGRIIRPPSYRAKLVSYEEPDFGGLPGVRKVVRRGSFLGVIADSEYAAIKAMAIVSRHCQWREFDDLPDEDALPEFLMSQPAELETLCDELPDAQGAERGVSAAYTRPYVAHASIAPSCSIAWWRDERLEVWSHSQSVFEMCKDIAVVLGISRDSIIARHAESSGCYGHNGADDAALDAALLACEVKGHPVRVQWMREDEFGWEPFGPAMALRLEGGVDVDGRIAWWDQHLWGNRHISRPGRLSGPALLAAWHLEEGFEQPLPVDMPLHMGGGSQRNAVPYYDFPKRVTNHAVTSIPLRTSALRALAAHLNVFAIESFMDELAGVANADPVEFRLRHLRDERARAVIQAVAKRAGWRAGAQSDGVRGRGFAFARYKNIGNYVAVVVDIELTETIQVKKVYAAADSGCIVNPDGVLNQCEGGVIQAVSWTLKEQVRFDNTRITTLDWESYPILNFSEAPQIDIELIDRPEEPSLGVGEGMTGPTSAAIANAVFHALGVRVRDLPLTAERVMAAMYADA